MAAIRTSRLQVGSSPWISEQRESALEIAETEVEEFTFSARNELEWLNEHMAEVFNENQINVADIFKTPGKLRGKTPRTVKKRNPLESRVPLSDLFSTTPRAAPSPVRQQNVERHTPAFLVAEDPIQNEEPRPTQQQEVLSQGTQKSFDSGYHGSQMSTVPDGDARLRVTIATKTNSVKTAVPPALSQKEKEADEHRTSEGSFQSAKEEQTLPVQSEEELKSVELGSAGANQEASIQKLASPQKDSKHAVNPPTVPANQSGPFRSAHAAAQISKIHSKAEAVEIFDDMHSPSDNSSPLRPMVVRKSSLNFASLPAREPLTTKKSIGARTSRTSHLDQSRTSYYGRATGGKSMGGIRHDDRQDDDDYDDDEVNGGLRGDRQDESDVDAKATKMHNKTYTQRLQDQISKLGQSQSQGPRPSKSIPNLATTTTASQPSAPPQDLPKAASPFRTINAPGAFPEDEDSWIGPPVGVANASQPFIFSPRPALYMKSYSTDLMDGIHGKDSIGGAEFNIPKQRGDDVRHRSPLREPIIPERTTSTLGHGKSASTSIFKSPQREAGVDYPVLKGISVSNPASMHDDANNPTTPKSPSRSYRESPLKAAKDKLSSILKTSKTLFASSAAASAAAKGSALSPPAPRIGLHDAPSMDSILNQQRATSHLNTSHDEPDVKNVHGRSQSPVKSPRRTRASTEKEDRLREKEAKEVREAQKIEQKLERLREKENEKARQFSQQERDRVAAMERQILANKEQERAAKSAQIEVPKANRTSPRKMKMPLESEGKVAATSQHMDDRDIDIEMMDAASTGPPTNLARSLVGKPRDPTKRPMKPNEKAGPPAKPVVIRVDTGSQRGPRNLHHPSNISLATSLGESLSQPPGRSVLSKPGQSSSQKAKTILSSTIRPKASTSSLKSVSSNPGKVKALEIAAKKREEAEQETQRKRNAKLESDRKRAALLESKQAEQQRREEAQRQAERAERQREKDQAASQAEAKKASQRAALEKKVEMEQAKLQRPPPPAPRPQTTFEREQVDLQEKPLPAAPLGRSDAGPPRPPSRLNSMRPQDEFLRSVNQPLQNTTKAPPKRPLPQDIGDEPQSRPTLQRNPQSYQQTESKRRRTGEHEDEEIVDSPPRRQMAPPVRQSGIKKDASRGIFPNGYASVQQPVHPSSSLHKATLTAQHMQSKAVHPMDMAQHSKAAINFAPNPSQAASQSHKTPARPPTVMAGGKSTSKAAKSSPRYQNGDSIDLPEINTDSEDEDSDDSSDKKAFPVPNWANSPALRAGIMRQEAIDPASVFGIPGEIKLEEVFKNKERHGRFRNRTSSANWSGSDRLTEEEVARDMVARERLRREGGWSYGLS